MMQGSDIETIKGDAPDGDPRVFMAAERTLLSWIRTGLSMMGFGFVVARFGIFLREFAFGQHVLPPRGHGLSLWLGIALVALGIAVNIASAWRYARITADIRAGRAFRSVQPDLGVVVAVLLAVLGLAMAIYLVAVAR